MIAAALNRVLLIAHNTLREAVRQRMFVVSLLVTSALALGALALGEFNFGASELKFSADLGLGALSLFGSLLAIAGTVHTVFVEIEQRTDQLIFVRPVSRLEYVAGKFIGLQLVQGLFCLLILAVLAAVLSTRESAFLPAGIELTGRGGFFSGGGLMLAVGAQWLKCGVMTASILLLCGIAQSRLFANVTGVILLIIFHAHPILTAISRRDSGSLLKWPAQIVVRLAPDFQRFDLSAAVFPNQGSGVEAAPGLLVYGLVFTAGYALLAAYSFRARD